MTIEIFAFVLSAAYLIFMSVLFASSLSSSKKPKAAKVKTDEPLITVIAFVSQLEDLSQENFIALFDQDYPREKMEFIIIDQTGNFDNISRHHEVFYQTRFLPLSIKTLSWSIITEIIRHKSHGEIVVFIQGRSKVSKSWLAGIVRGFHPSGAVLVLPKLVSEDKSAKHWFQAEQSLFRTVLSLAFAKWRILYSIKLNNIGFWRKDLLQEKESYLAWLAALLKNKTVSVCSDGIETVASLSPAEKWSTFFNEYSTQLKMTNTLLTHSVTGLLFIVLRILMVLVPMAYFILFLLKVSGFLPVLLLFFAKFIGEGLIISRGARLYQRQDLLYPFWSWFFLAPLLYGLAFVKSLFQKKRVKSF